MRHLTLQWDLSQWTKPDGCICLVTRLHILTNDKCPWHQSITRDMLPPPRLVIREVQVQNTAVRSSGARSEVRYATVPKRTGRSVLVRSKNG